MIRVVMFPKSLFHTFSRLLLVASVLTSGLTPMASATDLPVAFSPSMPEWTSQALSASAVSAQFLEHLNSADVFLHSKIFRSLKALRSHHRVKAASRFRQNLKNLVERNVVLSQVTKLLVLPGRGPETILLVQRILAIKLSLLMRRLKAQVRDDKKVPEHTKKLLLDLQEMNTPFSEEPVFRALADLVGVQSLRQYRLILMDIGSYIAFFELFSFLEDRPATETITPNDAKTLLDGILRVYRNKGWRGGIPSFARRRVLKFRMSFKEAYQHAKGHPGTISRMPRWKWLSDGVVATALYWRWNVCWLQERIEIKQAYERRLYLGTVLADVIAKSLPISDGLRAYLQSTARLKERETMDPKSLAVAAAILEAIRLGYGIPEVRDAEQILRTDSQVINVGVYGRSDEDVWSLLQEGSRRQDANFILLFNRSSFRQSKENGHPILKVFDGLVLRDGKAYVVRFNRPEILHFLVDYDRDIESENGYPDEREKEIPVPSVPSETHYFDSKIKVQLLLDHQRVPVPKSLIFIPQNRVAELELPEEVFKTRKASVAAFVRQHGNAVLKPDSRAGGDGILFVTDQNLDDAARILVRAEHDYESFILQSRIQAPKLLEGPQQFDWNARVFVAWDRTVQRPVVSDILIRFDRDGGPVNISLTAKALTLEDLSARLHQSRDEAQMMKSKIENAALRGYVAVRQQMIEDGLLKDSEIPTQFMGADVMYSAADRQAYIIELNGYQSGGMYDLDAYLRDHPSRRAADERRIGRSVRAWIDTMVADAQAYRKLLARPWQADHPAIKHSMLGWTTPDLLVNEIMEALLETALENQRQWATAKNLRKRLYAASGSLSVIAQLLTRLSRDPGSGVVSRKFLFWRRFRLDLSWVTEAVALRRLRHAGNLEEIGTLPPTTLAHRLGGRPVYETAGDAAALNQVNLTTQSPSSIPGVLFQRAMDVYERPQGHQATADSAGVFGRQPGCDGFSDGLGRSFSDCHQSPHRFIQRHSRAPGNPLSPRRPRTRGHPSPLSPVGRIKQKMFEPAFKEKSLRIYRTGLKRPANGRCLLGGFPVF